MRDLAAIARLSTGHFCRSFTRSFGTAPFAYVAARRLARAQELMLQTDEPLSQIALACGLCDQSHLTRGFREFSGVTPGEYRPAAPGSALHMEIDGERGVGQILRVCRRVLGAFRAQHEQGFDRGGRWIALRLGRAVRRHAAEQ